MAAAAVAAIGAAAAAAVRYAARSEFTSTAHCQRGAAHYATIILRQDNKNSHLLHDMCVCVCSDILSVLAAAATLSLSVSLTHILIILLIKSCTRGVCAMCIYAIYLINLFILQLVGI